MAIVARFLGGIMDANFPSKTKNNNDFPIVLKFSFFKKTTVAKSIITDVSTPDNRGLAMAVISMAVKQKKKKENCEI